jgi:1,4-alpha-glucan branching enzyme
MTKAQPAGYLNLTLHAHMPYVVNHGSWPHGMEWILEAAAESYLPLLRVLGRLEADGIPFKANLSLTPVLLEQLAHPIFQAELPDYLSRKIAAAAADEEEFCATGQPRLAETARWWQARFSQALADFEALGRSIVAGFKRFSDSGMIEIMTCGATHGYFPLLGTDESILAQIATGAAVHRRHLGKDPRGIWLPECGYRPAGLWQPPVIAAGGTSSAEAFLRLGIEEAVQQGGRGGIDYFYVDTHLIEQSVSYTPYDLMHGAEEQAEEQLASSAYARTVYQPYVVEGPAATSHSVKVFPRDPRTGLQVWSGDLGYPGDGVYLDFHKKRWPGGHRYWQVTHSKADQSMKTPYFPDRALARAQVHAEHFVGVVVDALQPSLRRDGAPPILTSPFDAELFGHWWHEGPEWIEHVARTLAREEIPVAMITCSEFLDRFPATAHVAMREGSWGQNGDNSVWLNQETTWTWAHIYAAEERVRRIASERAWQDGGVGQRIVKQLCRELLLMESSDWQFLITTGAARDYAETRFAAHVSEFKALEAAWADFQVNGALSPETETALQVVETRDSIFADIDPSLWASASQRTSVR